jgi:hypothetical protein
MHSATRMPASPAQLSAEMNALDHAVSNLLRSTWRGEAGQGALRRMRASLGQSQWVPTGPNRLGEAIS